MTLTVNPIPLCDNYVARLGSTARGFSKGPPAVRSRAAGATFDDTADLKQHITSLHWANGGPLPPTTGKEEDTLEAPEFHCEVCDESLPYLESEIRKHLQSHQLTLARYAFNHLVNARNLLETPGEDYWMWVASIMVNRPYLFVYTETYPLLPPTPPEPQPLSLPPLPPNSPRTETPLEMSASSPATTSETESPVSPPCAGVQTATEPQPPASFQRSDILLTSEDPDTLQGLTTPSQGGSVDLEPEQELQLFLDSNAPTVGRGSEKPPQWPLPFEEAAFSDMTHLHPSLLTLNQAQTSLAISMLNTPTTSAHNLAYPQTSMSATVSTTFLTVPPNEPLTSTSLQKPIAAIVLATPPTVGPLTGSEGSRCNYSPQPRACR